MSYLAKSDSFNFLDSKQRDSTSIHLPALSSANTEFMQAPLVGIPLKWSMLDSVPVGLLILDNKGSVVYENAEALQIIGVELKGSYWYQVINDYFVPQKDDGFDLTLKNGKRVKLKTNAYDQGQSQLISLVDVSDSRKYQEKRSHEDRIYQTGQMVSKLAHQIRTPLSSSLIYANLLSTDDSAYKERLLDGLRQIEGQVQDLLLYCRRETLLDESIDLCALLSDLQQDYGSPHTRNIDIQLVLEGEVGACLKGNRVALLGSFSNLINNAIEAHEEFRRFSEDGNDVDELAIVMRHFASKQGIKISIEDNGPGLDATAMSRITEPFYTTKSNGTGLGLSVVQSVIAAHGGSLSFEKSQLGGLRVIMEFSYD